MDAGSVICGLLAGLALGAVGALVLVLRAYEHVEERIDQALARALIPDAVASKAVEGDRPQLRAVAPEMSLGEFDRAMRERGLDPSGP